MANWYDNVPAPTDRDGRKVPLGTRELVYKGETREVWGIAYNVALGLWGGLLLWHGRAETPQRLHPARQLGEVGGGREEDAA